MTEGGKMTDEHDTLTDTGIGPFLENDLLRVILKKNWIVLQRQQRKLLWIGWNMSRRYSS